MLQTEHFTPSLEQKNKVGSFTQEGLANLIHEQFSPAYTYDRASAGSGEQTVGKISHKKLGDILPAFNVDSSYTFTKAEHVVPGGVQLDFSPVKPTEAATAIPKLTGKTTELHPFLAALKGSQEAVEEKLQTKFAEDLRSPLIEQVENRNFVGATPSWNFEAENCYHSIQINPNEGWSKTIITLSDLSATRIETRYTDKTSSLAYLDHLGRRINESNFDRSGNLLSLTETLYENPDQPSLATSQRITKDGITSLVSLNSFNRAPATKSDSLIKSA